MWVRRVVHRRDRAIAGLCLVTATLVAAVSALGVFARGSGATETVRSVRGEMYEMVTDGVYAYNAERYVAEGFGWDLMTLFVLGYFFYQYLRYAMSWVVGPLLFAYIPIYALSLVGIAVIVSAVDLGELAASVTGRFPRKGVAVLCAAIALLLPSMWIPRMVSGVGGELKGALQMVLSAWATEGTLDVGGLGIFAVAAVASLALAVGMFRSIRPPPVLRAYGPG